MKIISVVIAMTVLMIGQGNTVTAEEIQTAAEIMRKVQETVFYAGSDSSSELKITEGQGSQTHGPVRMKILKRNDPRSRVQNTYMYISEPEDLAGISCLVRKIHGQQERGKVYLPSQGEIQEIPPEKNCADFLGLKFGGEDLLGPDLDTYDYELIDAKVSGHYLIRAWPQDSNKAGAAESRIWVRQRDYVPVKIERLGPQGQLQRLIEIQEVENIQKHPTITKILIKDIEDDFETVLLFDKISYDQDLNKDLFKEESLTKPPNDFGN